MADRSIELALEVTAETQRAAAGLADVGDAARAMATDVDAASDKAAQAANRLDRVAGSADGLDDAGGRATGALGALASGFELIGAEGAAQGLQSAAMATDFFSGVGQAATLVMDKFKISTIKDAAAKVKHAAVTRVSAAATRAQAVAQRVLNAAMRANPIGVAITAALILIGLFVLLYKRSERFRSIVQAVMRAAGAAIDGAIAVLGDLVAWARDKVPAAFGKARDTAVAVFTRIREAVRDKVDSITTKVAEITTKVVEVATAIRNNITDAFQGAVATVQNLIGFVGDLIAKIANIVLPDLGALGRALSSRVAAPAPAADARTSARARPVHISVQGAVDPDRTARQIQGLLGTRAYRMGAFGLA